MNLSEFFVLAVTLLSVACAKQQSSNEASQTYDVINQSAQQNLRANIFRSATIALREGLTKGTNIMENAEKNFNVSVSEAENSIDDPEAVKEMLNKDFAQTWKEIFGSVPPSFQCFGDSLALSNVGAEEGLRNASVLLQKAGTSIGKQLEFAQNMLNFGIDAGGFAAKTLLKAIQLTVRAGFTGWYTDCQQAAKIGNKALRDADQAGPNAQGAEDTNCDAAEKDSYGKDAVNEVKDAANKALQRGANSDLVEEYKNSLICALGDIIAITNQGRETVDNLLPLAESDPKAAIEKYYSVIRRVKDVVYSTAGKIYVATGDVGYKSGKESTKEINECVLAIGQGETEITKGVDAGGEILEVGLMYKGNTPSDTVNAVAGTGFYSKIAYLQSIVKCSKLVLSVI